MQQRESKKATIAELARKTLASVGIDDQIEETMYHVLAANLSLEDTCALKAAILPNWQANQQKVEYLFEKIKEKVGDSDLTGKYSDDLMETATTTAKLWFVLGFAVAKTILGS